MGVECQMDHYMASFSHLFVIWLNVSELFCIFPLFFESDPQERRHHRNNLASAGQKARIVSYWIVKAISLTG